MKKKILLISTIILPCLLLTLSYKYLTKNNEVPKTISSTKTYENPFKVLGENSLALTLNGEATTLSYEELMRTKLVNKITCEKGSTAVWNQTSNSIELTNIKIPDYCTIDFKEGYKVTVSIPNGTVTTTNPVEVGHNETATFTIKANSGYTLTGATVSGTGCTISGNTVIAKNITSTRTCTVTLKEDISKYLYGKILSDKTTRPGGDRPNLSTGGYTEENTKTLYQTTKTENRKASYYFAGNAQDNWILFAGNYWRIIRINEDNSVRLLYVGPNKNTTVGYINGSTAYNSTYNEPRYAGYMYGTSTGSLANDRGNNTNSTIKGVIDSWYNTNITGKTDGSNAYDKYVSRTAIYCNDRSIGEGTYGTGAAFYFGANTRLSTNKAPSYKCGQNASTGLFESSQATADKFSGSTTGGGNGNLTYPVALMTADEVAFAGGVNGTNSAAWYYYNAAGTSVTGEKHWWTLSPTRRGSNASMYVYYVYGAANPGMLLDIRNDYARTVRPALSLKSCVKWSTGDGTSDNPYTVTIDSTCASALN